MNPKDMDKKTLSPVIDILQEKHPNILIPNLDDEDWASFKDYDECLDSVPVMCEQETVKEMASKLRGGAGPGSVDVSTLSMWLLRRGKYSQMLCEELAEWKEWLCNEHPPFAASRALMSCRLIALDKQPGVRPRDRRDIAASHCKMRARGLRRGHQG